MVNKGGWIRIVEASIAVLLIFGVIILISNGTREVKERDLSDVLPIILEEMSKDQVLRNKILSYNSGLTETEIPNSDILERVNLFVQSRIVDASLSYDLKICEPSMLCSLENYPPEAQTGLYTSERIFGTSIDNTQFTPKKVKLFLWKRS